MKETFDLYMEVVEFLHAGGGPYEKMDATTCRNLIDAIVHGRYFLDRDQAGNIVTFCDYWRIKSEDVGLVGIGERPDDVEAGEILFAVDCVNVDRSRKTMRIVREHLKECPWAVKIAWFHKKIDPRKFRIYEVSYG